MATSTACEVSPKETSLLWALQFDSLFIFIDCMAWSWGLSLLFCEWCCCIGGSTMQERNSLFSRHSLENEVMVHHCRELVRQDLHCSHLCKLYSRLGITDMIQAGGRFVHVDTHVPNERFFFVTSSFIHSSIFDIRIFRYSHPRLMHTHDSWFLPDLPVPGNLHDCWWCLSQLTSQNDRWRGPLIHHRFGIGWPSWTQLNSNWQSPLASVSFQLLARSWTKVNWFGQHWVIAMWRSAWRASHVRSWCESHWGGRLPDIQEFLMWIFMHIFRVHQWILFLLYWRSWSSFSSPSRMKSPKVECLVLKVPHQDEDFQDFLLVFKCQTNEPYEPFELLSLWILLLLLAFSPEAPKCDCFLNLVQCMEFGNSHPSHPRQEMASSQAFELWSISSGFAVKPSSHIATRCPTRKKRETVGKGASKHRTRCNKSIRSHSSFGGSPPEII